MIVFKEALREVGFTQRADVGARTSQRSSQRFHKKKFRKRNGKKNHNPWPINLIPRTTLDNVRIFVQPNRGTVLSEYF